MDMMNIKDIKDTQIASLCSLEKKVVNSGDRYIDNRGHIRRNYKLQANQGKKFTLYLRQNQQIIEDFSCGIRWDISQKEFLMLMRCNGSSHPHRNLLEKSRVDFVCHIHKATEKYISAGLQPDAFAEPSEQYGTLDEAFWYLVRNCSITGLDGDLFL